MYMWDFKRLTWSPWNWSSVKILSVNIFLTVCASLSELGPSKTHEKLSLKKLCESSNEKQGENLFLPRHHSAPLVQPFSGLASNRHLRDRP